VLRLVVGARFFNIVGHAGPGAIEASLASEIADALRAIDKAELIAEHWHDIAALDAGDDLPRPTVREGRLVAV
jgi:hypothetical protein